LEFPNLKQKQKTTVVWNFEFGHCDFFATSVNGGLADAFTTMQNRFTGRPVVGIMGAAQIAICGRTLHFKRQVRSSAPDSGVIDRILPPSSGPS